MTTTNHDHDELEDHDLGLVHDLPTLINRRRALSVLGFGGAGLFGLAACGSGEAGTTATTSSSRSAGGPGTGPPPDGPGGSGGAPGSGVDVAEGEIPEETGGPFPADGSNGVNVLTETGIVRSDLTTSFGGATGIAAGVPMRLRLRVLNLNGEDVAPYAGAAVYVWHCDINGDYSMYSDAITNENYLRGVQVADADGWLEFASIFPACYSGRWPHVHFEVYPSETTATTATDRLRTSQLALPKGVCDTVYSSPGYEHSVSTLSGLSLESDNVFSDGYSLQLARVTGSVSAGYTVTLTVPV